MSRLLGMEPQAAPTQTGQCAQQASPRHASRPSATATTAMNRPTNGSSHQAPRSALPSKPTSRAAARYAQRRFCLPSLAVAEEPILRPMRCLARPSKGINTKLLAASAIPTTLSSAWLPFMSVRTDSNATYGARMKNCTATSFCARSSASWESVRQPVKRQTITTLAKPFNRAVDAEADQRDGTGHDAGRDGDDALDCHIAQADPRQQLGLPRKAQILARTTCDLGCFHASNDTRQCVMIRPVAAKEIVVPGVAQVTPSASLNQLSLSATVHCLVGCASGEITGMALGAAFGFSNAATVALAIGLAFLFGYALTSLPLLRSELALAAVVPIALASDTVSIAIMETIDNAFVLAVPGAMDTGLDDALFWTALLGGFALAFGPAFLVNRANIRRGKGCCPGSRMPVRRTG